MAGNLSREPLLDMFIFEATQLIEQLEQAVLKDEKLNSFSSESINEIFRIMHTIKGSSAMMLFNGISSLAHSVEDLFYFIREHKPENIDFTKLCDLVLKAVDYIKNEIFNIENEYAANADSSLLINEIKDFLMLLKNSSNISSEKLTEVVAPTKKQRYYISSYNKPSSETRNIYKARITFTEDCEMENIRAFAVIHNLKDVVEIIEYDPANIIDSEESAEINKKEGFVVLFATELAIDEVREVLNKTLFLKELEISQIQETEKPKPKKIDLEKINSEIQSQLTVLSEAEKDSSVAAKQSFISVNIQKLDMLMDMVGELVISEAMVTRNPEITKLEIEGFQKASRLHRKIIAELQDLVMSVRMVPLLATFQKMNRIVRDMSKKLRKEVQLEIMGEDTEVDKNIIENISDPLMHLIRNSLDHGLENAEERADKNKPVIGKVSLEARNAGGDVLIIVKDDGRGLDKAKILEKAQKNGLTTKSESELSDMEIFSFIFKAGFSTNENVTEYSGRGVGMDVVTKNVEKIGGTIDVESFKDVGTTFTIKIPLTLAIIDGMVVSVGNSSYIVPTVSIRESFRPKENEVITDPDGNEMILIRGICYPILRLHRQFDIETKIQNFTDGIIIMVEDGKEGICLFADELIGQQQIVVKALPKYIKKVKGLAGCTLLGDGSISLIIDVGMLINNRKER